MSLWETSFWFSTSSQVQLLYISLTNNIQGGKLRTYRTEVLNMYAFRRLSEVREITDSWIREYNEDRPHDSLSDLTPREYLEANSDQENSKSTWA